VHKVLANKDVNRALREVVWPALNRLDVPVIELFRGERALKVS
jgi:hypothetical protein